MPEKIATANFGAANGGLATVGYRLLNADLTTYSSRTTSGVSEVITNSGIYRATVNYPPNFKGIVMWDTGEVTPQYAAESINPVDATSISDEVRTMIRSLVASLGDKIEKVQGKKDPEMKRLLDELKDARKAIKDVLEAVSGIEISPKVEVTADHGRIEAMLKALSQDLAASATAREESMKSLLRAIQGGLDNRTRVLSSEIKKSLEAASQSLSDADNRSETRIAGRFDAVRGIVEKSLQQISGEIKGELATLVQRLSEKSKAEDLLQELMATAGRAPTSRDPQKAPIDPETLKVMLGLFGGRRG